MSLVGTPMAGRFAAPDRLAEPGRFLEAIGGGRRLGCWGTVGAIRSALSVHGEFGRRDVGEAGRSPLRLS